MDRTKTLRLRSTRSGTIQKFTAGFSKCEDVSVGSDTVQLVCVEYATRRKQFKKTRLSWRVSNPKSAKYSLGWIPFKSVFKVFANCPMLRG